MDRINEIGDTKKGQEMLGRTAERAYQRAQRTSGADKNRYMRTYNDAYKTGGKSSNKHLGGSREHFDNGRDYEYEKWADEHNGNVAESKNMNKKLIRLTESDLHKIVKESAKRIMKEVALKGKSGKTYSLHGTDPESWAVMSRLRGKNGYFPNTPQHYHACRDEDNWIELDDKAHPNLRSRNNANRINAMMNRIDDKSKDIMAANESKLSRILKESVNRILKETVVHPHICDPRDETYRLEEQGWEHNLWNAIDIDSCMEEGTFSIDVGFFDYTYCVGHEVIPVGSVLECRDIIQAIAKGEKVNNENFMMELENCFYNDEYSEIDSLGFDIISPSGYRAADARGQHSYANLFQ